MGIGNITVGKVGNITVRQTGNQARVQTISYGGSTQLPPNIINEINNIYEEANTALILAQSSYNTANNKVDRTGDTMTGTLIVEQPAEVIATIDGGEFL